MTDTVVLRLVGAARVHSCIGGYGPLAATASAAADELLLHGRPARIPAHWERSVRHVLAIRAGSNCRG